MTPESGLVWEVLLMKCAHCQSENRETAEFCGDCGQSRRSPTLCRKCGNANPVGRKFCDKCGHSLVEPASAQAPPPAPPTPAPSATAPASAPVPASFANGRYQVKKFLGEGGKKKKVYLAKDTILDRDVAFALIKTEKLDEAGRTRVKREAQAMARLDHPNIVSVL